jgi:hypothetical protein
VTDVLGFTKDGKYLLFENTMASPLERHVHALDWAMSKVDATGMKIKSIDLTPSNGTNKCSFNTENGQMLNIFSSTQTPRKIFWIDVPNYIVTTEGKVIQLLDDISYSNYFTEQNINRNSVVVCLENLGWLEKKPLTNYYINWKGSIYNKQVYEKKWRDFFFWQPYTTSQTETTGELCNQIIESLNLERKFIGHNTKVEGVSRFGGIVSKSNFDTSNTYLNPSFNFEMFTKFIEYEQLAK